MKRIVVSFYLILLFASCFESGVEKENKEEYKQTLFLTTLYLVRQSGNCIKTDSTLANNNQFCSRRPLGVCSVNQLVLTQNELNVMLNEMRTIQNRTTDCQESILQSGILVLKVTTANETEILKSRFSFRVVDSCEFEGFQVSSGKRLANFSEIQWLESVRGKIAKAAKTIANNGFLPQVNRDRANSCLNLEFKDWEKDLAQGNLENKILVEINPP
ncbi:hypothetical protein ND861_02080 [Leptospira sp. 2 VSF19]|uniref:Lipoprotein n=1 Tax=Leptospira soteropolitanensis TaxID=2950025 RepID=A0AAW5VFM9_9LEPT|nr:hypothetical protein [Leptospira soteropolitanensis]MCW7491435.1 hypothetical protein [Leptospira soteropolitanensis]MCW7499019.1 hypothetical protein [Leptospira soteropolitanensis]MCW7521389.1 hypothetical protein [Leptospira soteropolitanensis]MCW7525123.1 hypothetical protein [Leptospira soteropolitanensis]MCW7528990.1 hypothetical protein [Leptospira soteropolitanensis]